MLVMMLSDQAQEMFGTLLKVLGAEVWRKLLWEDEPGVVVKYGAMLRSLLTRRFGEHDETDLALEIESFERDISKYEQQSGDLISDVIKHGIVCEGMAHQGLKQHIDLSISRLSMYKALRDEIINDSRARRTWSDPNAMQVDAVHVNVNQERPGGGSGLRPDKSKSGKGRQAQVQEGRQGQGEREEKAGSRFEGECRGTARRRKKAECRKMKSDIAAGKCDKSGKPTGVNSLTGTGTTQPFPQASYAPCMASTISLQQMVTIPSETLFINVVVPAQKTLMVARPGWSRIRVIGFWIWLDVMPD